MRFHFDAERARPETDRHAAELQAFGTIAKLPIGLSEAVCLASVDRLNQILADMMTLRDLYKKHHWQVTGRTFYPLHLLFDKHFEEQTELVDDIAERIQMLGGVSYAMAADVAEATNIPRPPRGREEVPVQISRLLTIAGQSETLNEARVREAFFIVEPNQAQLAEIRDLLDSAALRAFVEAVFDLDQAREAYARAKRGGMRGKVVLQANQGGSGCP